MSDKEDKTLPVALLVTGIGCIMILSCCFVWMVVRCERYRRRRKYRPKRANRYSINASHMTNGQELKDLQPRQLKPSVNLIHYSSRHSVNSQSIPSLLSAGDSMMDADSIASEPLYPCGRNYAGAGEDETDYLPPQHRDLSIARILGSFPELPYYQPRDPGSSAESINKRPTVTAAPIPRPRSSNFTKSSEKLKDVSINPILYGAQYRSEDSLGRGMDATSTRSASSAESLKVEIPGGAIRARDMADMFQFTKLRGKKSKVVSGNAIKVMGSSSLTKPIAEGNEESSSGSNGNGNSEQSKSSKPTFETEV